MLAAGPKLLEAWENVKALVLAALVHVLAAVFIVLGTSSWKPFKPPVITGMTIEAVMVDTQALVDRRETAEREARQARQREQARQQRERDLAAQAQREREQAAAAERARIAAEQEAARVETERERQAELRLAELRERQQRERQAKIDQQQKALEQVQEQRRAAEREARIQEEAARQLAARREAEEAALKQVEAEAAMQAQMAAEAAARRQGQLGDLRSQYISAITVQVTNNWLRPPTARPGMRCTVSIVQIPGGDVISASIKGSCNADEATRRSLIAAVERTGSLPYRGFEEVFEREADFIFSYDGD